MGDIYAKPIKGTEILICSEGETVQKVIVGSYYITIEKHTQDTATVRVGDKVGYEEKQVFPGKAKRMYGDSVIIRHERG